ncbi:uncharacterized protein BJ171DRAFT_520438 [Polychytrium aggregatum]|uniref:uncharacterized protein n=1 Tax=Polychytrium aggregatum TaxID=110093 RepID=UPI0022FE8D05|nr:uncharacterized protein BJ171DRAFT_520438 [Polychytrium aggregatum]KAI9197281.1 hypothetical protein BJ171DRAFT_520438 [Polychytrium aggregatum]
MASIEVLFEAIKQNRADDVRNILLNDKSLTSAKHRDPTIKFDAELELDAYKFLGAYLGSITALQWALMCGQDAIAKDIVERTLKDDIDVAFGGGNTALHLATFLGARELVKLLLERGADRSIKNSKGFAPVDLVDDPEIKRIYESN